jgi:hypothetical protein
VHVLHVQRHEEEHGEHRERDDEGDDVGSEERSGAEVGELDHGRACAQLDERKRGKRGDRGHEEHDDPARAPAPGVAFDQGEDERAQAAREEQDSGDVHARLDRFVA